MMYKTKEAADKVISALSAQKPIHIEHAHKQHNPDIDAFFDNLFLTFMSRDPQTLSQLGIFESMGVISHNAYLNDISPEALVHDYEERKAGLKLLQEYSYESLSHSQKLSYKIFHCMLEHAAGAENFLFHEYKVNQLFGVLADLSILLTQYHRLEVVTDIEHYLSRMARIPKQIEQVIALMNYQKNLGICPPRFSLEKVIEIIQKSLPTDIKQHIFYTHLEKRTQQIKPENPETLLSHARLILQQEIYPAYKKLQNYCHELQAKSNNNHGVWALPDGDQYYAHQLARHTTTTLTADQIHEIGLREVANIHAQMRTILATEGIVNPNEPVGVLVRKLAEDERFYFPNTDAGRLACIEHYEAILARCRIQLYHLFDNKPQAPVTIKPIPKHEEDGMPGAYYLVPSMDGSRPGIFFANLRNMREVPMYGMETLLIHEAEPGHHFQLALQQEIDMPILRKMSDYTAYIEGWALYAEKLAYEHNFYSSSFSKLGHLRDELLRAARLVVDTGIHKKRWSREEAIEYMEMTTGFHHDSIVTEVERYFVMPGQACSYKMGQLKILELRKRAQDSLGSLFDIRQFHNVVLNVGACPLTILEDVVEEYINQQLGS